MRWLAVALFAVSLTFMNSNAFAGESEPDCLRNAVVAGCEAVGAYIGARRCGENRTATGQAIGGFVGGTMYDFLSSAHGSGQAHSKAEEAQPPAEQSDHMPEGTSSEPSDEQDAQPQDDQPN